MKLLNLETSIKTCREVFTFGNDYANGLVLPLTNMSGASVCMPLQEWLQ